MRLILKQDVRPYFLRIGPRIPWPLRNPLKQLRVADGLNIDILRTLWRIAKAVDSSNYWAPLTSFARWVSFLPASENHHHPGHFGLLQHSLGLALRFLKHFRTHPDDRRRLEALPPEARRPWLLAGLLAALFRDCGTMLDVEVRPISSGKVWNPLTEPLTTYTTRLGMQSKLEIEVRFIPGRGLKGHEAKGRALIPVILPPSYPVDLTQKTLAVYDACASYDELADPRAHWPAAWFAGIVVMAAREDIAQDLKRRRVHSGGPGVPDANGSGSTAGEDDVSTPAEISTKEGLPQPAVV